MNILVLAPHTDDAEIGAGGFIAKAASLGHRVKCIAFSYAVDSIPDCFPVDATKTEYEKAMGILGIWDFTCYDFNVRHFSEYRQDILELLVLTRNHFAPGLVVLPDSHDNHQDHEVIHNEGLRAFKSVGSILGYAAPWTMPVGHQARLTLGDEARQKKLNAVRTYKSQEYRNDIDFVDLLMGINGRIANAKYAESFEVIKWNIMLSTLLSKSTQPPS